MMTNRFRTICTCVIVCAATYVLAANLLAQDTALSNTWQVLGRSLEDRVIEYRQFGEGSRQVLVVGPLEGDETAGLELVESLAEHLARFPRRTNGVQVTIVRDPNPDGRLRRTAVNARGVLLDRNFPTRGWRKIPSGNFWLSGREPESEPETRALIDLLADLRPDCLIVLATAHRQTELTYIGPAEEIARDLAKLNGLRPAAANATAGQGSLAVYAGGDRNVPTLVVRVPAGMRRDTLWNTYKRGLLAVIGGDTADDNSLAGSTDTPSGKNAVGSSPPATAGAAVPSAANTSGNPAFSGVKQNVPPWAESQTTLTASKGPASESGRSHSTPRVPGVTAGPNLESAGELVPVAPIRREFGPAVTSPAAVFPRTSQPTGQRPVMSRRATIRANSQGAFPPATLVRPGGGGLIPLPPSTMPSQALSVPDTTKVERFPPVDQASPPPTLRSLPQPIPLYPETGY